MFVYGIIALLVVAVAVMGVQYLGVECHYIVDAFLCQDIVDTQLG